MIIPTYNRPIKLRNCLTSLFNQTRLPNQIVIVDNSTDYSTKNIIAKLKEKKKIDVKYIPEIKRGSSFCRNTGIKHSDGKILAFIDDDCIADKNWVKNILFFVKKYKYYLLMGCNINGNKNNIFSIVEDFRARDKFEKNVYVSNGSYYAKFLDTKNCAFQKKIFEENNLLFDSRYADFSSNEDLDMGLEFQKRGYKIHYIKNIVIKHYGCDNFMSLIKREFAKGRARYHFDTKWHLNTYPRLKTFFNTITDLSRDRIICSRPLHIKLNLLSLHIFCNLSYKIGRYYELILNDSDH